WKFNRRVEFHIVAQYDESTVEFPDYGGTTKLPWTGAQSTVVTPPTPDELEREALRKYYEEQAKQKAQDSFQSEEDDGVEIGEPPASEVESGDSEDAPTVKPA